MHVINVTHTKRGDSFATTSLVLTDINFTFGPVYEISNNVVCATSKAQISLRIRAV